MPVWRTLDPGLMARLLLAASEEWRRERSRPSQQEERPQEIPSLAAPVFGLLEPKG